jgi:Copper transport outer membrane protein, MctB
MVVTIGGGGAALSPPSSAFLVPFVGDLVTLGVVTGAGESVSSDDGFISGVRSASNDSGNPLVTVDNADMPIGSSAMVLGLQSVLFGGPGGDYGIKADASRLLPPPA